MKEKKDIEIRTKMSIVINTTIEILKVTKEYREWFILILP